MKQPGCVKLCTVVALSLFSFAQSLLVNDDCVQVGSFNVKFFTVDKSSDSIVLDTVAKVILRYDVMLMLEIQDDDIQTAMTRLWSKVNQTASYGLALSQPLGRYPDFYTEQYGFFYRTDRVQLLDTFQYDDSANNDFEREPFAVFLKSVSSGTGTAFIGSHIQPKNAVGEMNLMVQVTDSVLTHWSTDRAVILGDLNADCSYMSATDLTQTPLQADPRFTWLIPDDADTTVSSNTDCAYDRIIVTNTVIHGQASVFYFDTAYNMTFDEAWAVSDHYPVQVNMCSL